jgi:hypothetical protein
MRNQSGFDIVHTSCTGSNLGFEPYRDGGIFAASGLGHLEHCQFVMVLKVWNLQMSELGRQPILQRRSPYSAGQHSVDLCGGVGLRLIADARKLIGRRPVEKRIHHHIPLLEIEHPTAHNSPPDATMRPRLNIVRACP